jgi:hypothetical protein
VEKDDLRKLNVGQQRDDGEVGIRVTQGEVVNSSYFQKKTPSFDRPKFTDPLIHFM